MRQTHKRKQGDREDAQEDARQKTEDRMYTEEAINTEEARQRKNEKMKRKMN